MKQDAFYLSIVDGLSRNLDPDLFEACVTDILRTEYPTLVPIPGGTDAGQDGAIADGLGVPFPLVVTTEKDVIGNLTKSLKSYLKDGGRRRKAVLATSQALSPRRRRNLESRAEELGFELVQTYTREAIAIRLYLSPH